MSATRTTWQGPGVEIAAATRGVPGVAGLSTGHFGTRATPMVGGRVDGVALRAERVEIGIIAEWNWPLMELAATVRAVVAPLADGRAVDITIEDLLGPADVPEASQRARELGHHTQHPIPASKL